MMCTDFTWPNGLNSSATSASVTSGPRLPMNMFMDEKPGMRPALSWWCLDRLDVVGARLAVVAGADFERNLLAFLQRLEPVHVDRRKMREEIFAAAIGSDESETFCIIEPLDCTGCHGDIPR